MQHDLEVVAARLAAEDLTFSEWRAIQPELAKLNDDARTEGDHIAVLKIHRQFLTAARPLLDPDTFAQIEAVHRGEYKLFLNKEAIEDGHFNPMLLERITAREVASGRLSEDDDLRQLAISGAATLGDTADLAMRHERPGNWLLLGVVSAALIGLLLQSLGVSLLWLIPVGFVAGYFPNDRERKRIKAEIEARRRSHSRYR